MDLNLRLTGNRIIKFDEGNKGGNDNKPEEGGLTPTASTVPEDKPVTASIQDVLASYAQGTVKFVSMTGNQSLPPIQDGVTEFDYEGSEVTTYVRDGDLRSIQIRGNVNPEIIIKFDVIGEFDEEDFVKSGISLEEYTNPNEDVIQRLVEYVSTEYNQTSVYTDTDDE